MAGGARTKADRDGAALDDARCATLAALCYGGDEAAGKELLALLWPHWERLVRASRSMSLLRDNQDHVASAVAHVAARVARGRWRALGRFPSWRARHPDRAFGDWLRIVTANALRDYVRTVAGGSTRSRGWDGPSPKRLLNELALLMPVDDFGVRPPVTEQQTALELLAFAQGHLPEQQLAVLTRWLSAESCEEIADTLGLGGPEQAHRLVRAAIATLRRRFAARADAEPHVADERAAPPMPPSDPRTAPS